MASVSASTIDYVDLVRDDRVHGRLYYDEAIFEEELEKIWYREWVYVGHESEIPESGDYRTRMIGLQPVIMTRDEDGGVHLLMNRCAHRGNTVCQMERGNSHAFRCAYHGWTFANDGHLLGVTYASAYGSDFNRDEYALTRVPRIGSYRGFIFGSMSPMGPSLDEHLGHAKEYIDEFVDISPVGELDARAGTHKIRIEANWKMWVENAVDNYHANFVHQSAFVTQGQRDGSIAMSSDDSLALTRDLGRGHTQLDMAPQQRKMGRVLHGGSGVHSAIPGASETAYVEALEKRLGKERAEYLLSGGPPHIMIFPNLFLLHQDIRVIQPVSVNKSYVYQYLTLLKGAPVEVNRERVRQHVGAYGPAGFILSDDMDIFERNQLGFGARVNEWLSLARGIHRERRDERGLPVGHPTDELAIRGIWKHYRSLMTTSAVAG